MKMNVVIIIFSMFALVLAACSGLRPDPTAAEEGEDMPTPAFTPAPTANPSSSQMPSSCALPTQKTPSADDPVTSATDALGGSPLPFTAFQPQPGDETLIRSQVFLDLAELLTLESYPLQFRIHLKGNLPDPCHQLRVQIHPPDAQQRVLVEAYSVADANAICAQVLVPFEESLPLEGLPAGTFAVVLSGQYLGEVVVSP
jgi:hypothetical protein